MSDIFGQDEELLAPQEMSDISSQNEEQTATKEYKLFLDRLRNC